MFVWDEMISGLDYIYICAIRGVNWCTRLVGWGRNNETCQRVRRYISCGIRISRATNTDQNWEGANCERFGSVITASAGTLHIGTSCHTFCHFLSLSQSWGWAYDLNPSPWPLSFVWNNANRPIAHLCCAAWQSRPLWRHPWHCSYQYQYQY